MKIFLILLLVFLLLASIPAPILILPTAILYIFITCLWIMNKKSRAFNAEAYDQAHGKLLTVFGVNYLHGLPDRKKILYHIPMFLTTQGFLFQSSKLNLYIDYCKVENFELIKDSGTLLESNFIWDNINAKLFEITFLNDNNQRLCLRFEMNISSIHTHKNYSACEELVQIIKKNKIYDQFNSSFFITEPLPTTKFSSTSKNI